MQREQNARLIGKTLLFLVGLMANSVILFAQTWTQASAPSAYWHGMASSADGTKMAAVSYGGGVYTSTNSGATWNLTSVPSGGGFIPAWRAIASSADGTKLIAVGLYGNPIYLSTNFGVSWTTSNIPNEWETIACSADGKKLVAATYSYNGKIYTSKNFGATWTQAMDVPDNNWEAVASSTDGTKLVAVGSGVLGYGQGPIYVSTNSGASWMMTSAPLAPWISVAASSDGTKIVAVSQWGYPTPGGFIYTSLDSGKNWTLKNAPNEPWSSVTLSSDGTKLMAVAYNFSSSSGSGDSYAGGIFTSTDSGDTWTQTIGPSNYWYAATASADGCKRAVAVSNGGIFTAQTAPTPQLNLTASSSNLLVSWLVPSTNLVLQKSADMTSWVNLTNPVTLNFTDLQNQVIETPSNSSSFYRLATP